MKSIAAALLLSTGIAQSFQLPFKLPFTSTFNAEEQVAPSGPPRIAIIGAGAGGSSAAFWISKARERFGLEVEVDVFDKNSYIGGRMSFYMNVLVQRLHLTSGSTTVYPYDNSSLPPIELGASIFVAANKNMWRASEEFNLSRGGLKDDDGTTGIWDGEKIVITVGCICPHIHKLLANVNLPRLVAVGGTL
jgi:prenylcysteine oxidase / farnesylcysteine lyase